MAGREDDIELAEAITRFMTEPGPPITEGASLHWEDFEACKRQWLGIGCGFCRGYGIVDGQRCLVCAGTGEKNGEE